MRKELSFWLLILVFVSAVLGLCSVVHAAESTIVLMDNTTIKTVHRYDGQTKQGNWDDVAVIKDPTAEAACFDRIKLYRNRADRYAQLESCLTGVLG